jgi:hypothetical protein
MKAKWLHLLWLLPLALVAFICSYAWPPDFSGREITLAEFTAPDGTNLRVMQRWNHVDFYTTLLYVTPPNASRIECFIDGDDRKRWSGKIQTQAGSPYAHIVTGSEERGVFNFEKMKFTKAGW